MKEKRQKKLDGFNIEKEFKKIKKNESLISKSVNKLYDKWISI